MLLLARKFGKPADPPPPYYLKWDLPDTASGWGQTGTFGVDLATHSFVLAGSLGPLQWDIDDNGISNSAWGVIYERVVTLAEVPYIDGYDYRARFFGSSSFYSNNDNAKLYSCSGTGGSGSRTLVASNGLEGSSSLTTFTPRSDHQSFVYQVTAGCNGGSAEVNLNVNGSTWIDINNDGIYL